MAWGIIDGAECSRGVGHLALDCRCEVYVAHVRQSDQVEQNVAQLLPEVHPLLLAPPPQPPLAVAVLLPLKALAQLPRLADQRESDAAREVVLLPPARPRKLRLCRENASIIVKSAKRDSPAAGTGSERAEPV